MIYAAASLLWLALGVIASGWHYAYFQREYPERATRDRDGDRRAALLLLPFGLCAFIGMLMFFSEKGCDMSHGWLWPGGDEK